MQREQDHAGIKELQHPGGTTTLDPKEKANIMNEFFANIGEKTAQKIPWTEKEPMAYLDEFEDGNPDHNKEFKQFLKCDQNEVERSSSL